MRQRVFLALGAMAGLTMLMGGVAACGDDDSVSSAGEDRIAIENAFVPEPPADVASAYMVVKNRGERADRLIRATSDAAGTVELHRTSMENGAMKMSKVEGIDVPAEGELKLERGGYHIMLFDPRRALKKGDEVALTLTFEQAGEIAVVARVVESAAMGPMSGGSGPSGSR